MTVSSGEGNDFVSSWFSDCSIVGGDGDDTVWNTGDSVTIDGGAGDDTVDNNEADEVLIYGGEGNDTIENKGANVTITGGTGDDVISLSSDAINNVINYTNGDGKDIILGYSSNTTLNIAGAKYVTKYDKDDIVYTVGEGSITLKDARHKPKPIIIGESGSSGGGSGGSGGGGTSGNGGGHGGGSTGGTSNSGNNSAASGGNSASGSSGTNSSGGSSGNGNRNRSSYQTTTSDSSTQQFLNIPSGNHLISSYQSGEKLFLSAGYTGAFFNKAGDFVAGSWAGAVVVRNAVEKVIDISDGRGNAFVKAYAARKAGIIDGRGIAGFEVIQGSTGSDEIHAGDGGSQLWGGEGYAPDTLVGGNGGDTFVVGKTHGADLILNASSADVVHLKDAALSDITATSENNGMISVSFNTGNVINVQSTDTFSARFNLTDGSAYRYNHATKSWETLQQISTPAQRIYKGGNQVIADYQSGEKIFFGAGYTGSQFDDEGNFCINSPSGKLVIQNPTDKMIDLNTATGKSLAKAYAASTAGIIDGRGLDGFEIIKGSAGADVICAGDDGSQLWGGADNATDVLIGGNGNDIFVGGKSQGNDLFLNASVADVVNLTDVTVGDITSAEESGGKISISFNTGNVVNVQSSDFLSAKFILADGSAYRYSHAEKSWQGA